MTKEIVIGVLIPFLGTTLGSACVLFMKKQINELLHRCLAGFAAGVMIAASIWSLLIPSLDQAASMGKLSFIPAVSGFWVGILFLLFLDKTVPHLHSGDDKPEGVKSEFQKTTMLVLAVAIHNIPEGMAAGVVLAGWRSGNAGITIAGALALSIGIAIQNFPEGAIISMPLHSNGMSKGKSFLLGTLSGAVEPVAAVLTIIASALVIPVLPYLMSFAAGAMIYVVIEELVPEMSGSEHSNLGTIAFTIGFTIMLVLETALA